MSKLGKKPISIPKDTKVKVENGKLVMTGPKGSKELTINDKIFTATVDENNFITLKQNNKKDDSKKAKDRPAVEKKETKSESDTPVSDAKEEEQVDEEIKKETQEEAVDTENQTETTEEDKVEEETDEKKEG